ncbi:MAG: sulfate ABC transporter ATP-binding protein [Phycisphaerales bacterium]|nr:MAG: sulfate ABC transporter ATP-binding protein [Phycisphaerales bacterium]
MSIELRQISKTFGGFRALTDVSVSVQTGELLALLGPSGSGKTTLLRIIAGLEQPDPGSGPILFHHEDVAQRKVVDRRVGFVFQHYALFRHMTVLQNVAFGLRVRPRRQRISRSDAHDKAHRLLRLVQLDTMAHRYPHQLSGGQRQRVALARALAIEPKVLLLDEPFGALDAKVRQELRGWLRKLHDEIHVTSVFVTHDQEEALELADRVVVMNEGRIEQFGTPDEVFHRPHTEFVMNFLGQVNSFHGRLENGRVHFASLAVDAPEHVGASPRAVRVFIRPHELGIDTERNHHPQMTATVAHIHSAGANVRVELTTEGDESLVAELSQDQFRMLGIAAGDAVFVTPREVKVFADARERLAGSG